MPVEIKELVIRAVTRADDSETENDSQTKDSAVDQDAMIQACVKQVLRILQKKKER